MRRETRIITHSDKALQSALGLKITVIEGNAGVKVWRAEINHDHKSQEGSCRCGVGSTASLSKDLGEKSLLIYGEVGGGNAPPWPLRR